MIIKQKKIYLICLAATVITMAIGYPLSYKKNILGDIGSILCIISTVGGILCGNLRLALDAFLFGIRKKESKVIVFNLPLLFLKLCFKLLSFLTISLCLPICIIFIPIISAPVCFFKYKDDLVEA